MTILYNLTEKTAYKLKTNMVSKRFTLNKEEVSFVLERAKLFLIPLMVVYIPFVIQKIVSDGFQLKDFLMDDFEKGALVLWVLNRLLTAGQLFLQGKK